MNQKLALYASALTLTVIAIVGCIDGILDDNFGAAGLFGVLAVGIVGLTRIRRNELTVSVRRDLASWMDRVSPVTGETPDEMSDRAISRLRAGFIDLTEDDS